MIYKAERTKLDVENLARRNDDMRFQEFEPEADYRGVVVNKPWGYEYLMFKNTHMEIWILFIREGHATSMHCHRHKKTSLSVIAGNAEFSTLSGDKKLSSFDAVVIDPETFHSTRAASEGGVVVMEVETPSNKRDVVRLKDLYGREDQGYEGSSHISKELHKYDHCYFASVADIGRRHIKGRGLGVFEAGNLAQLKNHFNVYTPKLTIVLEGKMLDAVGSGVAYPGDVATGEYFKENIGGNCYLHSGKISLLTITEEIHA